MEHSNGIKISTLDNPGWRLTIDLKDTSLEGIELSTIKIDRSDDDWFYYWIMDNKFEAAGGPRNLSDMLTALRTQVENK